MIVVAVIPTVAGQLYCDKTEKRVLVDGSSTVYPITEAVAEEFRNVDSSIKVTVGVSGTGGGFKKFCSSEIDISNASRPIKPIEQKKCKAGAVDYIELAVAYDGLAVLTHKENDFVKQFTVDQLKKIFQYGSAAKTWKRVNPNWPDKKIKVYAPGKDSGTYDYFVETILGKKAQLRSDATFSEDDNVLVTGIAGEKYSVGFMGLAYYEENRDKLSLIAVINPRSGQVVTPNIKTVKDGSYAPLSRPIFIYVNLASLERAEVRQFVTFYMQQGATLSKETGYIPLNEEQYRKSRSKIENI